MRIRGGRTDQVVANGFSGMYTVHDSGCPYSHSPIAVHWSAKEQLDPHIGGSLWEKAGNGEGADGEWYWFFFVLLFLGEHSFK
jgi:hypothetical protein